MDSSERCFQKLSKSSKGGSIVSGSAECMQDGVAVKFIKNCYLLKVETKEVGNYVTAFIIVEDFYVPTVEANVMIRATRETKRTHYSLMSTAYRSPLSGL